MKHQNFKLNKITLAVTTTLFFTAPSWATPIIKVYSETSSPLKSYSTSDTSDDGIKSVDIGSAKADPSGNFFLSAEVLWEQRTETSFASYSMADTFTNTTGTAGIFDFNFLFNEGHLSVDHKDFYLGADYAASSYNVSILVNDNQVWHSGIELKNQASGQSITQSGEILSFVERPDWRLDEISWEDQNFSINLGLIDTDETIKIEYLVEVMSDMRWLESSTDWWDYGGTAVNFSDPYDILGTPVFDADSLQLSAVQVDVPEPSTSVLLGLGLAGLAFPRRKKASDCR